MPGVPINFEIYWGIKLLRVWIIKGKKTWSKYPSLFREALRIPQPAPLRENAEYRSNYTNANAQDQTDSSPFYWGITATIANRRVTILQVVKAGRQWSSTQSQQESH